MTPDTASDDATLDGIHGGPLTEAELRTWRRQQAELRKINWLRKTGWKGLVALAGMASGLAYAIKWMSDHYKP